MSTWIEGIQNAIEYIENNLTENLTIKDIAEKAYVSEFYFQRIFLALCGFSVAEYIRNRRMTLAARELLSNNLKVIDVAIKYGYDSPDSFARAFTKFHGVTPSAAREQGVKLCDFAPLKIILSLEGGNMMEYRIEEKATFTVIGKKKVFKLSTSYQEVPKYWQEHCNSPDQKIVCGMYGICMDMNDSDFTYMIADNYFPWKKTPAGFETITFSQGTWAIFPCTMSTLQETNTRMWKEWLPNCKDYKLGENFNIELYAPPNEDNNESYCELWLPIKKIN